MMLIEIHVGHFRLSPKKISSSLIYLVFTSICNLVFAVAVTDAIGVGAVVIVVVIVVVEVVGCGCS